MTRRRPPVGAALVLAAALMALPLSGCLGRSPDPRIFTLGAEPRTAGEPNRSELAILVGPSRFPRYLERPQIVRRLAGGELEIDEFNRWAGSFEENVGVALALDVARRIGSDRVVAFPSDPPFELDYRVRLHFDEFVVGPDRMLRLRARWATRAERGSTEAALGRTDLDRSLNDGSVEALIEAHEDAIRALGGAIVEEIERLEAGRP